MPFKRNIRKHKYISSEISKWNYEFDGKMAIKNVYHSVNIHYILVNLRHNIKYSNIPFSFVFNNTLLKFFIGTFY